MVTVNVLFLINDKQIYDIFRDRSVGTDIIPVRRSSFFSVKPGQGQIGGFVEDEAFFTFLRYSFMMSVFHFLQDQILIIPEIDDQQVVLHRIQEERHALLMKKICDPPYQIRIHFYGTQILHGFKVVEDSSIHGDNGKTKIDLRQSLPHSGGCLTGGNGKTHTVGDAPVQLDFGIGGHLPVLPEQYIVDPGHEQGRPVLDPG